MTDYRKRLEGKLAQLASRAEIMRQFADQFADKADPYWQTAEADATGFELEAADLRQLLAEGDRMRAALIRLRDCNWVITPLDRMDAVRGLARQALGDTE